MKLLAIDTATEALSVALYEGGVVASRFEVIGRGHAERVLPMVHEVLGEAGWALSALDAVAVGRGPGAFTGVRIAVSVAQGLAFGLDRPVVPVSDLAALAWRGIRHARAHGVPARAALACLDARMGEVYAGLASLTAEGAVQLEWERLQLPQTSIESLPDACVGVGHGFAAYPEPLSAAGRLLAVYPDLLPDAVDIAHIAVGEWALGRAVAPSALEPVYLRDDVATRSTKAPK